MSKGVLKQGMIDKIKSEGENDSGKVRQLLLDVQEWGPNAFRSLVSALADSDNAVAANVMEALPQFQEKSRYKTIICTICNHTFAHTSDRKQPDPMPASPTAFYDFNGRIPLEIKVKIATQYRGPPELKVLDILSIVNFLHFLDTVLSRMPIQ